MWAVAIIICIILVWWMRRRHYTHIVLGSASARVLSEYENRNDAARLIMQVVQRMMAFMRFMRKKYYIDSTDDVAFANVVAIEKWKKHPGDLYNIVHALLDNFNPETVYENSPNITGETSYTVDKGSRMYLCVRDKIQPGKLVDINSLMFVVLHECSHIANYAGWGHAPGFWRVFKFILHEARSFHTPVDYSKHPVTYCGLAINYSPYYDDNVKNIWLDTHVPLPQNKV